MNLSPNAQLFWGEVKRDWRKMLEKWAEVETPPPPPSQSYKQWWDENVNIPPPPPPMPHNPYFEYECAMMHAWIDNLDERLDSIARPYRKR
jgi:hypothetical protein